jgi:putative SOS response-associated peptidase YedK
MCGRFASYLPPEAVRALFRTMNPLVNFPPSWNVAPTDPAMVIRRHPETGDRHLDVLRWGLIPYFTKDLKAARKPINARAETAGSSAMHGAAPSSIEHVRETLSNSTCNAGRMPVT